MPFVLAHLSDPHLGPLPRMRWQDIVNKRALGVINWRRGRHRVHSPEVLARVVADIRAQGVDHVAVTGDLINISHAEEFEPAAGWLATLGPPAGVTLVPGNHDAYLRAAAALHQSHWGDYMRGDDAERTAFPFVRRRGPVALIGLSSAVPTGPLMASGLLGPAQLAAIGPLLDRAAEQGLFRVVLLHHPARRRTSHHKRLVDAAGFRAVIARHGAELILHGHDHIHSVEPLDGPRGPVPMVGVPSASAAGGGDEPAGYNLYEVDGDATAWTCRVVSRGLVPASGDIIETRRFDLAGALR